MPIEMGPVLSLVRADPDRWELSCLVVAGEQPEDLHCPDRTDTAGPFEPLWSMEGRTAFRARFSLALRDRPTEIEYRIGEAAFAIALPALGMAPRVAYGSCNGFSSLKAMKGVADKNCLWRKMAAQHGSKPFHLLLLGGDQVYADSMWENVPSMEAWGELSWEKGNNVQATEGMKDDLARFYFDLYTKRWAQLEVAQMLSRVPTIAMWDDHDIIDGWGSYPKDRQTCSVYRDAIWPAARKAFRTFQHQLMDGEPHPAAIAPDQGQTIGHVIASVAILALDMRTERTMAQVLSPSHWDLVYRWAEGLRGPRHLLLMSSIPVIYPGFDTLERLLGIFPGYQDLEDDLADHWSSRPHKGERLRLIHRLLALAEKARIRPTIISGDVHVGALGYVESRRAEAGSGAVINQLISSGIVHPGPGGAVLFALRHLFDNSDEIDRGIVGRMVEFPGTQDRFIGGRNFLTLTPDLTEAPRLWAEWVLEKDEHPYTKVIHSLEASGGTAVVKDAA
jgi:hypothetical protein